MRSVDEAALRRLIAERVAAWNGTPPADVPMDRPLADLGMASRDAVALAGELSRATGRELPTTLLWETPTGQALVERLCETPAPGAGVAPVPRARRLSWRSGATWSRRPPWDSSVRRSRRS